MATDLGNSVKEVLSKSTSAAGLTEGQILQAAGILRESPLFKYIDALNQPTPPKIGSEELAAVITEHLAYMQRLADYQSSWRSKVPTPAQAALGLTALTAGTALYAGGAVGGWMMEFMTSRINFLNAQEVIPETKYLVGGLAFLLGSGSELARRYGVKWVTPAVLATCCILAISAGQDRKVNAPLQTAVISVLEKVGGSTTAQLRAQVKADTEQLRALEEQRAADIKSYDTRINDKNPHNDADARADKARSDKDLVPKIDELKAKIPATTAKLAEAERVKPEQATAEVVSIALWGLMMSLGIFAFSGGARLAIDLSQQQSNAVKQRRLLTKEGQDLLAAPEEAATRMAGNAWAMVHAFYNKIVQASNLSEEEKKKYLEEFPNREETAKVAGHAFAREIFVRRAKAAGANDNLQTAAASGSPARPAAAASAAAGNGAQHPSV